jgi:hypothetical protein
VLLLLHCAKKRWGREEVVSRLQKMPGLTRRRRDSSRHPPLRVSASSVRGRPVAKVGGMRAGRFAPSRLVRWAPGQTAPPMPQPGATGQRGRGGVGRSVTSGSDNGPARREVRRVSVNKRVRPLVEKDLTHRQEQEPSTASSAPTRCPRPRPRPLTNVNLWLQLHWYLVVSSRIPHDIFLFFWSRGW